MDLGRFIEEYQTNIGMNINKIMKEKNIVQKDIVEKCKRAGYNLSQGTISNAKSGRGNVTIANLLAIAYALEVDIYDLIADVDSERNKEIEEGYKPSEVPESELFITNPKSKFFRGYLGTYNTIFFKTTGMGREVVRGKLNFGENEDGSRCRAILKLFVENDTGSKREKIEKVYDGNLILSNSMHAAYCYLYNQEAGELCMLVFHQWFSINNEVESVMAAAITTASGSNRFPTVHRMCISRKYIEAKDMEFVEGQLLMNTAEIYLTEEKLKEIMDDPKVPRSFKEMLQKMAHKRCICIPETSLFDSELDEEEMHKWVSYIRAHSKAPKYNKISRRTEEALYALVKNIP